MVIVNHKVEEITNRLKFSYIDKIGEVKKNGAGYYFDASIVYKNRINRKTFVSNHIERTEKMFKIFKKKIYLSKARNIVCLMIVISFSLLMIASIDLNTLFSYLNFTFSR